MWRAPDQSEGSTLPARRAGWLGVVRGQVQPSPAESLQVPGGQTGEVAIAEVVRQHQHDVGSLTAHRGEGEE